MIDFNRSLEAFGELIYASSQLSKQFAHSSTSQLIKIISTLDSHSKGFITFNELIGNSPKFETNEFIKYLIQNFEQRITYSCLVSYLQNIQNNSSTNLLINTCTLKSQNIQQLIKYKFQINQTQKSILTNIGLYIVGQRNKISSIEFENYCHSQKLSINPTIIFNHLAFNQEFIYINHNQRKGLQKNSQVNNEVEKTKEKINRLKCCLNKLDGRVNQFGTEWL